MIKHLNYNHYGLQITSDCRSKGPFVINDEFHTRISTGTVAMKTDVAYFGERSVSFVDKTEVANLDAIIFCTGYTIGFDFLDETIISPSANNDLMLYKYIFPPREPKATLAFIGFITIKGSMNPTVEMQARWAVGVVKGTIRLPSTDEMMNEIRQTREDLLRNVDDTPRHALVVNT
jgi:dimethylaniline monooxygenase (N-oxide forming)